jgi:hypothetical protein
MSVIERYINEFNQRYKRIYIDHKSPNQIGFNSALENQALTEAGVPSVLITDHVARRAKQLVTSDLYKPIQTENEPREFGQGIRFENLMLERPTMSAVEPDQPVVQPATQPVVQPATQSTAVQSNSDMAVLLSEYEKVIKQISSLQELMTHLLEQKQQLYNRILTNQSAVASRPATTNHTSEEFAYFNNLLDQFSNIL